MAERMVTLASAQPGFLGIESARDADGFGITVSYWSSPEAIKAWKEHADHVVAQETGINSWYEHYELRVARVERAYSGPIGERHASPLSGPEMPAQVLA
jgi:heme-degrading monooxygenase HmoA